MVVLMVTALHKFSGKFISADYKSTTTFTNTTLTENGYHVQIIQTRARSRRRVLGRLESFSFGRMLFFHRQGSIIRSEGWKL